jgi:hypothetical protein
MPSFELRVMNRKKLPHAPFAKKHARKVLLRAWELFFGGSFLFYAVGAVGVSSSSWVPGRSMMTRALS